MCAYVFGGFLCSSLCSGNSTKWWVLDWCQQDDLILSRQYSPQKVVLRRIRAVLVSGDAEYNCKRSSSFCWRTPKLVSNASHVNSLIANLPSPVTSASKLHYPVHSPNTVSSNDFLQNQTPKYKLFLLHCHTHTYRAQFINSLRLICKNTPEILLSMLHRMDLFGPDDMRFEIFSQVLLISLIITEIPQRHHNHFQQILMLVEGFRLLLTLHRHTYNCRPYWYTQQCWY